MIGGLTARSRPAEAERWANLGWFALSVGGYLFLAYVLWWGFSSGKFATPGGDALVWDRAGDQIRAGINPFQRVIDNPTSSFWYLPPMGVILSVTSLLPQLVQWAGIIALEVAALRYVCGSWRNVGFAAWFPLVGFELVSGNFNFVIAAGIVAAARGDPRLSTVMSFAKLSPALSIHPRDWRPAVVTGLVMVAITLPFLWLWPLWFQGITAAYGQPLGPQIPVGFLPRLALAGTLLLIRRPWTRALAAVVAIPAFYWITFVMLIAPLAVWSRRVARP